MTTQTYICTNETYCTNSDTFASVDEFRAYCVACLGEHPQLESRNYGDEWIDADTGEVVLSAVAD